MKLLSIDGLHGDTPPTVQIPSPQSQQFVSYYNSNSYLLSGFWS